MNLALTRTCGSGSDSTKMAPRAHRGAIVYLEQIRRLELHSDTGVNGRLGAGVRADSTGVQGADARSRIVVEAELVLPVAVGHPSRHELRVLRTQERLGGVESQADRLAVDFG